MCQSMNIDQSYYITDVNKFLKVEHSGFLCKNEIHLANYHKHKLCKLRYRKNPGRQFFVDPNKTIAAPYRQGNELLFGQNAGQQCIAMSLCCLIYNNTKGISTANDLIQIMNIGNMLYSSLSQLTRPAFLMESELPTLLNTFDIDYRLEYSETCATVGHYCRARMCAIEGHQNCTSLQGAFESLMSDNYTQISY